MDVPDYPLPPGVIAQEPLEPRHAARLLVSLDAGAPVRHCRVADLAELLEPEDVLVVNTSRVLAARLRPRKPSGGAAEVLLVEPEGNAGVESHRWRALVRPGRRLAPGTVLYHHGQPLVEVGEAAGDNLRRVRLLPEDRTVADLLAEAGAVPLPPYIRRPLLDRERYQTVFADRLGSVAAPTAGLHLSTEVLDRCRARGIRVLPVDLAIGLATFRPLRVDRAEDHIMPNERYQVPWATFAACRKARRVVAVGTTAVRALESAAATGRLQGSTDLYLHGADQFRLVDALLTNFHQPRSSLLVLVEAFCGPRWRDLYEVALTEGYRFLSFGDAMLVSRRSDRSGAPDGAAVAAQQSQPVQSSQPVEMSQPDQTRSLG